MTSGAQFRHLSKTWFLLSTVTRNEDLQKSLHYEQNRLFQSSEAVKKETLTEKNRPIPFWVKCVVALFPKLF